MIAANARNILKTTMLKKNFINQKWKNRKGQNHNS